MMSNEIDSQSIIKLVLNEESKISDSKNKDLVFFIGPSQCGKSTTINALLGVEFEMEDNGSLRPKNINDVRAPIGNLKEGGISVTKFPAIYATNTNLCFIDTQGFFDLRDDKEMNIASSILMEMAINNARSVRIVNLCKFDDFVNGLTTFHKFGEQLNRFITCDYEPIYFLFNRFCIPPKFVYKYYTMNESEKNDEIKKQLKEAYQNLENGRERIILQATNKIKELWGSIKIKLNEKEDEEEELLDLDLTQDTLFNDVMEKYDDEILPNIDIKNKLEELEEKYRYMSFIRNSFSNDYYGYIDPESKTSLDDFINTISNIPTINKNNLAFNGMTSERNYFNQLFEKEIAKEIDFMKKIKFIIKYNDDKITALENQLQSEIQRYEHFLANINDIPDELLGETHMNIKKELTQLELEKSVSESQLQHLVNSLKEFENAPAEPFWEETWDLEPGFLWWRNYLCKYDNSIPYEMVEENLDDYTKQYKVINEKSPLFEVEYSSKENAKTILIQNILKLTNPFPELKQNRCKGKVTLYTYKKNIEPQSIPLMEKEIVEINIKIDNIRNDIEQLNNRLIQDQNQQIQQIQQIVDERRNQVEEIINYKTIIDQVRNQWQNDNNKKMLWAKYYNIIKTLYSKRSNESIRKFKDLYESITVTVYDNINCSFHIFEKDFLFNFSRS